jgi:hypothetical protein
LLEIDIATRVVGPTEDIYIVRPGAEFALYEDFLAKSHVFLDLPGFGLSPSGAFPEKDIARAMATRSVAVKDWHSTERVGIEPTRDLQHYQRHVKGRRVGRYVVAAKRLNYDLRNGTIIVVPGPHFFSNVLIGEITGPRADVSVSAYPGEVLLGRPVRWVAKRSKSKFSAEFVEKLKTRNPLTQLERSLREEVLRAGYGQYTIDGLYTARLETTSADFSTLDDYDIQTLINYAAGALLAYENGYDKVGELSLVEALGLLRAHRDAVPEFASNINSPGFLRLFGGTVLPIAIVAIVSAALSGQAVAGDVQIGNSKGGTEDVCAMEVQQRVQGAVRLMRLDDLKQACIQTTHAKKDTGLKTSMTVKESHKVKK